MRSLRAILGGYNGKPLRQVGKFKKLGTDPLSDKVETAKQRLSRGYGDPGASSPLRTRWTVLRSFSAV